MQVFALAEFQINKIGTIYGKNLSNDIKNGGYRDFSVHLLRITTSQEKIASQDWASAECNFSFRDFSGLPKFFSHIPKNSIIFLYNIVHFHGDRQP